MFKNAVFQGVGVRAIASVGALAKLEEHNFKFQAVAGVSGGAIVAALYAAGYTAEEMKELLQKDFSEFLYLSKDHDFPNPNLLSPEKFESLDLWKLINLIFNISLKKPCFLHKQGVYTTKKIYSWIYDLLAIKDIRTFGDLENETGIDLKILTANVTEQKHEWFDKEKNRGTKIAQAVCCSVSIPIFFEPVILYPDEFVDGGILNTFPIFPFIEVPEHTVGFKFKQQPLMENNLPNFIKFFLKRIGTMWLAHDKLAEVQLENLSRIIIDTGEISSVKFSLDSQEKQELFDSGYQAAEKFYEENQLNYQQLADFLREEKWVEANQETFNLILNFCGKEKGQWLNPEDIENIEFNCLNTIDVLWKRYSNNRLGFTSQKKIWDDVGKPSGIIDFYNPFQADLTAKKWLEFGKKIGWFKPEFSFDLRKFLLSFAPQDPQTMKNNIIQANKIEDIPLGSLPNSILFWYGLGIEEQFRSISKQSLLLLATLYSRFE